MAVTDMLYQVRAETLEQIERGRDNILRCRVYDAGALVAPSSGTVSVYDRAGTAIVSAAAVTIASSEARYTLTGATTTGLDREIGWRIEWSLVMPDGTSRYPRRDAALVTTRLYPPATLADVFRRVSSLDPAASHPATSKTLAELDAYVDEAWLDIESRLLQSGRLPWLVLSPQSLRLPHILGTLALLYEDLRTRLNPAYDQLATEYRRQYEAAWSSVELTVAEDDDDLGTTSQQSAVGSLFLCGR